MRAILVALAHHVAMATGTAKRGGVCGGQANLADARVEGTRACLHGSRALPSSPAGACCNVSAASVDTEQRAAGKAHPSLRLSHAWEGGWWWAGMVGAGWGEVVAKLLRRQILPLFGALMLIHSERTSCLSAHTVSALLFSPRFRTHFYSPS